MGTTSVHRAAIAAGRFLFATRNVAFVAVFLAVVFATRPRPFLGSLAADAWSDALGILIIVAGQGVRALAVGLSFGDIRRGGKDLKVHADALVTEGFFAHCRNPLYAGNLLIYLGLFLILNSPAGWLIGLPFFTFAYLLIVVAEEDFLRRRFGATYEEYCRRVPRFVPAPGLAHTLRTTPFDLKRVIRKEYGQVNAWSMTALALIVREHWVWATPSTRGPLLRNALLAWAILFVVYGVARYLKKSGRLVDA